jgi:DNA repair protein RecO (recombination protein O)
VKRLLSKGIILSRTDYGEADRILTILTPGQGKLRLMARGVRKAKSRLAGGIELFSTTDITYMNGRGEIGTLISSRLIKYYSTIVKDIDRVQLGYELIKILNRATEDQPEAEYFTLLEQSFAALDMPTVSTDLIRLWFQAQLLRLAGHSPNLRTDTAGQKLTPGQTYNFDFDAMAFAPHLAGNFAANHIKILRLLFADHRPSTMQQVQGIEALLPDLASPVHTMLIAFIRVN